MPRTFRPVEGRPRRPAIRRFTFLAAVALVALAAGVFVFSGRAAEFLTRRVSSGDFRATLAELDLVIAQAVSSGKTEEELATALDAAEEQALSVESGLSVLKRRRALAARFPGFPPYAEAAVRLAGRFPHSESAAAVAAEALLSSGQASRAAEFAGRLSDPRFASVVAAVLVRALKLSSPANLPAEADSLFLAAADAYRATEVASVSLVADAALARLLRGDGASALALLRERQDAGAPAGGMLLAELEYDFGDARTAAALFSLEGEALSSLRRADAASLAGDTEEAREAWKAVVSASADPALVGIALYDLAAVPSTRVADSTEARAAAKAEERAYLERLLALDPGNVAGAIRLSRSLAGAEGDAVIATARRARSDGLLDLERIRRAAETEGSGRTIGLLWLLMNERPEDRRVARWAAWYMETYGAVDDVALVLKAAGRAGVDEPWVDFHTSLRAAREGRLDEAEKGFSRAATVDGDWRIAADLAVIAEARRATRKALEHFEIAASLAKDSRDRSALQVRLARCLEALGKESEARRVLAYALELDGTNRTARVELKRLGGF